MQDLVAFFLPVLPIWEYIKWPLFYIGPFIALPIALKKLHYYWYEYMRHKLILKTDWALLEIILPKETFKSPQAMEVVLAAFNQSYGGNWWTRLTKGEYTTWFSLEMVSTEGRVHFYIRTLRLFKHLLESRLYAQYPDVEVREAEDYMRRVPYGIDPDWQLWGNQLKLAKEDAYPIRTYIDFGLDKVGDDEVMKTDPISPIIEVLGSLGPKEYMGIQILVQSSGKRYHVHHHWYEFWKNGLRDWKEEGKDLIKKLSKQDEMHKAGKDSFAVPGMFKLTPGETDVIKAVERSLSKLGFDVGIRTFYAAPKALYQLSHQLALSNSFGQFSTLNLNAFKTDFYTGVESVVKEWLGIAKKETDKIRRGIYDSYRLRHYFYPPYPWPHKHWHPFILNTEELATIFHFPGSVTTTGGLPRIESKKGEAPPNLPI